MPDAFENRTFRSGAGRLCLDFVRTLRYRGRPDADEELNTSSRLAEWAGLFGPCEPDGAHAATDVSIEAAHRLREAIYSLLVAAMSGAGARSCPPRHRRLVNDWAARQVPAPRLHVDGSVGHHAEDPVAATLSTAARDTLDLISGHQLGRVRRCANPDCNVLFLDSSRPGQRRWCSMATCGNTAKKAKKANQQARHS